MHHGSVYLRMAEAIWSAKAPLKCQLFMWLAVLNRIWTSERRERHGLQDSVDACAVSLQAEDTVDHILVQCPFAREVWFSCLTKLRTRVRPPSHDSNLQDWWSEERDRLDAKG
jgi:hypothetical protein